MAPEDIATNVVDCENPTKEENVNGEDISNKENTEDVSVVEKKKNKKKKKKKKKGLFLKNLKINF